MGDFALIWDPETGTSDLSLVSNDLESDEGLKTAILLSLFTDRLAGDDVIESGEDARGWWGDQFAENQNDKIGSLRWVLARSKIRRNMLSAIESYDREALSWLIDDRVLERIELDYSIVKSNLYTIVGVFRPDGRAAEFRFDHVWEPTLQAEGEINIESPPVVVEEEEDMALKYMDTIEVVSTITGPGQVVGPVSRISFMSGGDGKMDAALDSENDGRYLIDCYWVRPSGAGTCWMRLEPNGAPATPGESLETITWEQTITSPGGALEQAFSIAVHSEPSEHDFEVSFDPKIVAGRSQRLLYAKGTVIRDQNDWIFEFGMASRWDDVVTTFNQLDLVTSISNMIGVGSVFHLYRQARS